MKKIFTLIAVVALALTASAQEMVLFGPDMINTTYQDGQVFTTDNAKLTLSNDLKGWKNGFSEVKEGYYYEAFAQTVDYLNSDNEEKTGYGVAFINGGNNPKDDTDNKGSGINCAEGKTSAHLPQSGTFYIFQPTASGKVQFGIVLNANKAFYLLDATDAAIVHDDDKNKDYLDVVLPDANLQNYVIKDAEGNEVALADDGDAKGGKIVAEKTVGVLEFDAEAGKTYYFFCSGSKLGCFGYIFTPAASDLTETVLWEGEALVTGWANQPVVLSDGGAELKAVGAKAGDVLRFYMSAPDTNWQCELFDGHWNGMYLRWSGAPLFNEDGSERESVVVDLANVGYAEFELTEEALTKATTSGGWGGAFLLNGDGNITFTKLTIMQVGGSGPKPQGEKESIIDRFTYTWDPSESLTHNEDGSITFNAVSWGGLAAWLATEESPADLSAYDALVFEFAEATPCPTQGFVQTTSEDIKWWHDSGITKLECPFEDKDMSQVNQIALQCADPCTITITDIYLVKKTDGIQERVSLMNVFNPNAPMYNLSGVRVNKDYKGIVIQNGKKYINK